MFKKRAFALLTACILFASAVPAVTAYAEGEDVSATDAAAADTTGTQTASDNGGMSYSDYLTLHKDAATVSDKIGVNGGVLGYTAGSDVSTVNYDGKDAVQVNQGGFIEWTVNVEKAGLYAMNTLYYIPEGKGINAEMRVYLDGVTPYTESTTVTFSRIWKDADYGEDAKLNEYGHEYDATGNELTPDAQEVRRWQQYIIHDNDYMTDSDLLIYMEAGTHTFRLASQRENIAFAEVTFGGVSNVRSYKDVYKEYKDKGLKVYDGSALTFEAENSYEHSEQCLTMQSDGASSSTTPCHYSQIRLNTIGGEQWNSTGEWITWKVDVKEEGLYDLSFKYRQDYVRGFNVYRTISVNGEIPYSELSCVSFAPADKWKNMTVSDDDDNPYYIHLNKGTNYITLKSTLGPVAESLQVISKSINDLNAIYLKIIQITGTSPDTNRDYNLDTSIPGLMDEFKYIRKDLVKANKDISDYNGGIKGGLSSFIDVMVKQLDKFIKSPLDITAGMSAYKSNISSLSDMIQSMSEQSLLLDRIYLSGEKNDLPSPGAGFFDAISFSVKGFFSSFVTDYNAFGSVYSDGESAYKCEPIEVWMTSGAISTTGTAAVGAGRDQMNILKTMIDDEFVKKYNIPVNLSLVDVGASLTKAILAGAGPDCSLMVASATPINYSMRGALEDMDQFNAENQYSTDKNGKKVKNYEYTFDEVKKWFYDSAFMDVKYQDGKCYGLPETQKFKMLFYRTDVLQELGLEVPKTWDDLYDCVTVIQRKNMNIGIPPSDATMLAMMVLQNGGDYYTKDCSATDFNTEEAIQAFRSWTEFNTKYSMPVSYNALNRFRSGEYPIVLAPYTFYNELAVGAPEIKGLWSMANIPGTVQKDSDGNVILDENGNPEISYAQATEGTDCIMIRGCENKNYVYEFMTWWVSTKVQGEFGNKIEARLGSGGRYTPANKESFYLLPWSANEQEIIVDAWQGVEGIPKIPGDYYVTRMINNAYRAVVYKGQNAREALLRYSKEMDKEIQRKRAEYNVDDLYKKNNKTSSQSKSN